MLKDQTTVGMHSPIGSLRMSVELDGELSQHSCPTEIAKSLLNTLRTCGFFREEDIYIMPVAPTKPTTIVIYCEQKKTPEKNGAT
jgi:hypothetical protein